MNVLEEFYVHNYRSICTSHIVQILSVEYWRIRRKQVMPVIDTSQEHLPAISIGISALDGDQSAYPNIFFGEEKIHTRVSSIIRRDYYDHHSLAVISEQFELLCALDSSCACRRVFARSWPVDDARLFLHDKIPCQELLERADALGRDELIFRWKLSQVLAADHAAAAEPLILHGMATGQYDLNSRY